MPDESEILNSIFLGEVANVQNYGAFINIPGSKNQGLVHRSQMSSVPVDDAGEVLKKGDRVWCKVISFSNEGKIGLSMKVVDQGSGRDKDPNGVQIHQDEQKRKSVPPGGSRKKITLEAVLKTTCTKCGVKGHLGKDCFQSVDGKVYELIPEDEDDDSNTVSSSSKQHLKTIEKEHNKEKKRKKDKKQKKEKKKRSRKSSSSSDSGMMDNLRNQKKQKKRTRSWSRSPKKKQRV